VRYTLSCVECDQHDFPWDAAVELAGPPLSAAAAAGTDGGGVATASFNSVIVFICVAVASVVLVLLAVGMTVRGRRRNAAENQRITEMMQRSAAEGVRQQRSGRRSHKPPAMFEMGEPREGPLPPRYRGPIVVLQPALLHSGAADGESSGDDEAGSGGHGGKAARFWPQVAIARPETPCAEREARQERAQGGPDNVDGAAEAQPTQPRRARSQGGASPGGASPGGAETPPSSTSRSA